MHVSAHQCGKREQMLKYLESLSPGPLTNHQKDILKEMAKRRVDTVYNK